MNGIRPQPPEGGDPLGEVRRDLYLSDEWAMRLAGMIEERVAQLEQVLAARWPRRWLLRWRLGRQLRASVAPYSDWTGHSWTDKRGQAAGDEMIASDWPQPVVRSGATRQSAAATPQPPPATVPPASTGLAEDGSAVVGRADLPTLLGALHDAAACHSGHLGTPHVAAAYRAISRALGDDR